MVDTESDYVGTEKTVADIGVFPAQVDVTFRSEQGNNGFERRAAATLLFPSDLPLKINDGFCTSGTLPQYRITSIIEYPGYCKAEAELWT